MALETLTTTNEQDRIVKSKVPITPTLEKLLNPNLHKKEPIFTSPLKKPKEGEKVYDLSPEQIKAIQELRGAVVDLHPGMGGVVPSKLIQMIEDGIPVTSLDFMMTKGCNFECTWCYAGSSPFATEFLPFNKLESITQEAADIGVSLFILTGGEPLTYKDPALGKVNHRGEHFFKVVEMIKNTYERQGKEAKILTFDDVALINERIAEQFAHYKIGLCTKGDTLHPELQDYKVNQVGAFKKMEKGNENLIKVGYGKNPDLRNVVNSVFDHTTFDGMPDLHMLVKERGFDHSIVPIHFCGNAGDEDQEAGIHSPHVKVLYDLLSKVDEKYFDEHWEPWSAFTYNKTCNRNLSGLHIRANGDVTSCSESPGRDETDRYTFGNIFTDENFSLEELAFSNRLANYRTEFAEGSGTYVCAPDICDLNANDLCRGGCAVRSAYSGINYETGLIEEGTDVHNYSTHREDPLCPAWTKLALTQGILKEGLLSAIHERLLEKSEKLDIKDFPNPY
ncbi:hypothetical protein CL617_03585 [archaeon]|nr:hypothetical protein [archaeon]|tara:strand:- start:4582 stop:6099 length:1518 start_codon:yes stop_codon:yes gene_type:complete